MISWPWAAGSLLPETGASTTITSGRSRSTMAMTSLIPARPIVAIWTQIAPGARAVSIPWSRATEMTASASGTIVTTIPARRAASAALSATSAPRSARSRVASGWRSQTIVGMPARTALAAIPWPIVPMPRTATGSPVAAIGPPRACRILRLKYPPAGAILRRSVRRRQLTAKLTPPHLMDSMNALIAAASCRGEEIMVRCRPGTAVGVGAPIRAAA